MKKVTRFFAMIWFLATFIVDSIKLLYDKAEQEHIFREANAIDPETPLA